MVTNFVIRSSLLIAVTTTAACSIFWEVPATPLQDAAWRGDVAAISSSSRSADVAPRRRDPRRYWAARGGHPLGPHRCKGEEPGRPEVIAALIELGADPNIQDRRPKGFGRSSGWTPLFVALHHEQFQSARLMLEHGADPNILSDQGMSVVTVAAAEGAPKELIALMMEKGFDPQKPRRRAD